VKPVLPGSPSPVSPIKPVIPGAVAPVTPVAPGAPLKPASAVPAVLAKGNDKTGTQAVKTPPPKETARITVKPSLPAARPAGAGNLVGVKPVVAAGAVAATAGALTPAAPATPAAVSAKKPDAVPIAGIPAFEEEKSTTLTTALAGALALMTWGTAGILIASYLRML
jgi:hypothetical protein